MELAEGTLFLGAAALAGDAEFEYFELRTLHGIGHVVLTNTAFLSAEDFNMFFFDRANLDFTRERSYHPERLHAKTAILDACAELTRSNAQNFELGKLKADNVCGLAHVAAAVSTPYQHRCAVRRA